MTVFSRVHVILSKVWVILIVDRRFQKNLKKCFWSKLWRILFGSGFRNLGFGGWNRHQLLEDYFTSQLCIDLLECICSVLGNFHLKTQYNLHSISNFKTCVTSISVITNTFILLQIHIPVQIPNSGYLVIQALGPKVSHSSLASFLDAQIIPVHLFSEHP